MSLNFSLSPSVSPVSYYFSPSNSSPYLSVVTCLKAQKNVFFFTAFSITSLLLLPLFILVLCLGHRRWTKQRSVSTAATISHSDFFTYNMIATEMISIVGNCFICCGAYAGTPSVLIVGLYLFSISSPGQTAFHILTCVERYLAVVYPITYRGLKHSGGVRIRNIITGCVWLMCFLCLSLTEELVITFSSAAAACFLVFSFTAVTFCSLSVLCILIRPRPGDGGKEGERVDQVKQRAVNTIMIILAALLVRFMGLLACIVMYSLSVHHDEKCVMILSSFWFTVPSSLVLPLLYLHRAGKLACSCHHVLPAKQ